MYYTGTAWSPVVHHLLLFRASRQHSSFWLIVASFRANRGQTNTKTHTPRPNAGWTSIYKRFAWLTIDGSVKIRSVDRKIVWFTANRWPEWWVKCESITIWCGADICAAIGGPYGQDTRAAKMESKLWMERDAERRWRTVSVSRVCECKLKLRNAIYWSCCKGKTWSSQQTPHSHIEHGS